MMMGPVFEQFVEKSPISVTARAAVEQVLEPAALDKLFEEHCERGYTKELLFSTTVELMSRVACGKAPHVQSAYQQMLEEIPRPTHQRLREAQTHRDPRVRRTRPAHRRALRGSRPRTRRRLHAAAGRLRCQDRRRQPPRRHPETPQGHPGAH